MPDDEQHPKRDEAEKPEEAAADKPEAAEEGDKFRPDAIAARIEAIGEEDEADRIARQEEQKLLERKKGARKGGGGKKGLESAASKRLAKIGEAKVKRPGALGTADVTPDADPLLERLARAGKWIQEHRQTFGGLVAIGLLGAGGLFGWFYWQGKHQADASAMLAQAIADEKGRVSDKDDDDDDTAATQQGMYPTFKSASDRTAAALAKYRDVEAKYPGTGAAILARLSEGGLLLDSGDAKGALGAYSDVKTSPLAQADVEVRGRAIEGIGFADELLARTDEGNKDKHLDEALAAYKDLEAVDMKGFKELGQYHEARVQQAKGDKAKAIELLKAVHEKVADLGETHPFSYLEFVVEDRLRELDPTALPPKSAAPHGPPGGAGAGAGPGGLDTSDPKIQELLKKLQLQMQQGGGAPGAPGAPGLPPGLPPPPPSPPK
ncbi:MAG TPA: hypothetical protein VMI75_06545 [Polyangiaceae bacterium]|nr:hypothetical protein [Polyangiaceae bacterium]